jgi:ribosomal protein S18 acetylase RimI-like enzyme
MGVEIQAVQQVTDEDLAQAQGARSIDLTSRASRVEANRLYQQLGFQLRDSNVYRYQPQPRPR